MTKWMLIIRATKVEKESNMKVKVDVKKCVGHARCAASAPEVYELDDNGFNVTAERQVHIGQEQKARRGARACPERIITIEEE
jgi:ferredoxin|tara:strand:- start:978 stop:1226 length:249 start_codon:yes stop_codon:yes gene_type:complete